MCRMIATAGAVDPKTLLAAARRMAANDNPRYTHEFREQGPHFRHLDGWGAVWVDGKRLRTVRRTQSILEDGEADRTVKGLVTPWLVIHARRSSRGQPRMRNTHPFTAGFLGREWAFCHNGSVDDHWVFHRVPGLVPQGGTDSEQLFHHLLALIGERRAAEGTVALEPAVLEGLKLLRTFTAAHCLLASTDGVLAGAARHPQRGQPGYHALWQGRAPNLHVVSSEPLDEPACEWERIPEPGVVTLRANGASGS